MFLKLLHWYLLLLVALKIANSLKTKVPHHMETSQFALQINWLVSIWSGTLVVNGLIFYCVTLFTYFMLLLSYYTPLKAWKTFSCGIKKKHLPETCFFYIPSRIWCQLYTLNQNLWATYPINMFIISCYVPKKLKRW